MSHPKLSEQFLIHSECSIYVITIVNLSRPVLAVLTQLYILVAVLRTSDSESPSSHLLCSPFKNIVAMLGLSAFCLHLSLWLFKLELFPFQHSFETSTVVSFLFLSASPLSFQQVFIKYLLFPSPFCSKSAVPFSLSPSLYSFTK